MSPGDILLLKKGVIKSCTHFYKNILQTRIYPDGIGTASSFLKLALSFLVGVASTLTKWFSLGISALATLFTKATQPGRPALS